MSHILIVDDDDVFASATATFLREHGFTVDTAYSLTEAREKLSHRRSEIVLLDLMLPDGSGLDLLVDIDIDHVRIVIMTAFPTVDVAIDSLRSRVSDFLVKPIEPKQLLSSMEKLSRSMGRANPITAGRDLEPVFEGFIGNSPVMLELYKMIERVAPSDVSVLIQGESGTGKELVAQAIHQRSERRAHPFLSLNCGACPSELIGSELFGHEKGSFTGAARQHAGYFERARGGTLFLDEITEMPLAQQVQLLRVLETGRLVRLGGDREIDVDVRIISATNRNPKAAIKEGRLREDLYFRIAVFPVRMPTLNERPGDIALLAKYFLDRLNQQNKIVKRLPPQTLAWLEHKHWQGNVRELKNAIQRAYLLADEEITTAYFADQLNAPDALAPAAGKELNFAVGAASLDDIERHLIYATLKHYNGNKPKTAEALGISLKTLYNRLKEYDQGESDAKDSLGD